MKAVALTVGLALGVACSDDINVARPRTTVATASSTGAEAGGAGGNASATGTGGNTGGAGAGSGGVAGGGGAPLPCGVDCTTIQVPQCTDAQCNLMTLQCEIVAEPNGGTCDDGLMCTELDVCVGGTCSGMPKDCSNFPVPMCAVAQCDPSDGMCKAVLVTTCSLVSDGCCPTSCTPNNDADC